MRRVFSGIQPTARLHLGNYLGAIRNWVDLQDSHECLFCVVDLHALTVAHELEKLSDYTREVAATYIASGVDPDKCLIFNQSMVSEHTELSWIFACLTSLGWLNRMTQFKNKAEKNREGESLGLYAYPVLMAADILLYKATHVPVGDDQRQHLELVRNIAVTFNRRYGKDFFPLPEPQIYGAGTRVMSLRDGLNKMSKSNFSDYTRINLSDDHDTIRRKIRKARTDPGPILSSPELLNNRLEARNLISIYAALADLTLENVCEEFDGAQFSEFKPKLSELIIEKIGPIAKETKRLMKDRETLDNILRAGAEKAKEIASRSIAEIKELIGVLRV
jgi:tryptophanyl-tRNA synthetase